MSSSPHSTIVPFDSDIENTFSSTNILNYFSASPGSISPDSSNDFTKYLLDIQVFLPLHDDSKMEVIQAYDAIPPPQEISPKDTKTPVESPNLVPLSSSPVRTQSVTARRIGHMNRDCKAVVAATTERASVRSQTRNTCNECGRQGHYRNEGPKLRNQNHKNITRNESRNNEAKVKAYAIIGGGANLDSNVITNPNEVVKIPQALHWKEHEIINPSVPSTPFVPDRSFVSTTFSALFDIFPSTLDISYAVKLADGRTLETNVILSGFTLGLLGHPFDIDLLPVELSSFNVIIGMDWLAKCQAMIVCDKKIVRIPYGDEVLIIEGDGCNGGNSLPSKEGERGGRCLEPEGKDQATTSSSLSNEYMIESSKTDFEQAEARKEENYITEDLHGMINKLELRPEGMLCLNNMSWIPCFGNLRALIIVG
uniref:Reverse transcriptase domain-containing protein n=1 Tax=Tanacetum cinerariifolium TaxID=118510 RepID=A0A6L2MEE6_TANCI|nr:hypothetical protein [Tanacetum cinerariifolium]